MGLASSARGSRGAALFLQLRMKSWLLGSDSTWSTPIPAPLACDFPHEKSVIPPGKEIELHRLSSAGFGLGQAGRVSMLSFSAFIILAGHDFRDRAFRPHENTHAINVERPRHPLVVLAAKLVGPPIQNAIPCKAV